LQSAAAGCDFTHLYCAAEDPSVIAHESRHKRLAHALCRLLHIQPNSNIPAVFMV
jgi:citrate lyase synthetase